jgi:hypothetical protein
MKQSRNAEALPVEAFALKAMCFQRSCRKVPKRFLSKPSL